MTTQKFEVKGMHCASCSTIISKKISNLKGVTQCDVNFATEKASITFDPQSVSVERMNNEIGKLGYSLKPTQSSSTSLNHNHIEHLGLNQPKEDKVKELEELKTKVYVSLPLTLLTFLIMMWGIAAETLPYFPRFPIPMSIINSFLFILSAIFLFWVGKPFVDGVVRFIRYKVANMDTLVGIGTLTAFFYSSTILLFPTVRELLKVPEFTYFDITIVVIGFVTLGKYLEAKSKVKTGEAIEKLLSLQAKTALVKREGKELEIPIADVVVGDIVIVKPGAKIPVDGIILDGTTSIDESMITGESMPQDKKIGDIVVGATINKQGIITIKATKIGSDTMLAQIIKFVEEAQGSKAQIQNLADKISSVFVPVVLVIALATLVIWLSLGTVFLGFSQALSFGLMSFVGVLVIACPCALGLATPTAIIVGVGKGAENGLLIKNAESLENLNKVNTLVLDKTGTITSGKPSVTNIVSFDQKFSEADILKFASSLEKNSQHPLALAIVERSKELSINNLEVTLFNEIEGFGVEGILEGKQIIVRKPKEEEHTILEISKLENEGKTVVLIEINGKVCGAISISDTVKENAKLAIKNLHDLGVRTVMLTGDNKSAAQYIAKQVNIDEVVSQVLPQEKARVIKDLQQKGLIVSMVGDGINDAPALTQANVGIAMATGTDVAIESADITLLHGDITKISKAFKLSRQTIRTIKQNLFWAFIYNIVGIPLAAGAFYPFFGIFLNPIFAGLAMAMSSVSVVSNSLLLKRRGI